MALGAALAAGCSRGPRYAVEELTVLETPAAAQLEAAGVTRAELADAARRLLAAAPRFLPAGARGATRRVTARIAVERAEALVEPGGLPVAQVAISAELAARDGEPALRELARGAEPVGAAPAALAPALRRASEEALRRAVRALSLQLEAEAKRTSALVRDLASPDAEVRDHAVRVLGDRGDRAAVPALAERLRDPDPVVVERAVGALAQLRDPRAVPALIDLARRREEPFVAQMTHILGDIGGPEAEAWLATVAAGHPDEVVRGAAREALVDLRARDPRRLRRPPP